MIFASLPLIVLLVTFIGQFFIQFGDNPFYNNIDEWDTFFSYFSLNISSRLNEIFYNSIPNFIMEPIMRLFVHGFNLSFGSDHIGVDFAILQIAFSNILTLKGFFSLFLLIFNITLTIYIN